MKLSDKIRYLREVEGSLRGLDRAMTQGELVRAIQESADQESEAGKPGSGKGISQSYLSQLESGARPPLTNSTFQAELRTLDLIEDKLDLWLIAGAERFGRRDADLCRALLAVAHHDDSRGCLLLLESILKTPQLVGRLAAALKPLPAPAPTPRQPKRKASK